MIYIKKTSLSNNPQLLFFFIVLLMFSCKDKINTENIFIRVYPTQINDNEGIKNIFIDGKYIYIQKNNFMCDQTFLNKRLLLKNEIDSIDLILSQFSPHLDENNFKKNEYYADYYYIINLTTRDISKQFIVFQDQIPKEFKTLIDFARKICQRGSFKTLNSQFSNINMNYIHLISNQNDTIEISAFDSFLFWVKLNTNNVCFNLINNSDTIKSDYKIPILYNLDCEKEFTYFIIKDTKLFIKDKDNRIFHLTGDYSFLLKDNCLSNSLNK